MLNGTKPIVKTALLKIVKKAVCGDVKTSSGDGKELTEDDLFETLANRFAFCIAIFRVLLTRRR